MEYKGKQIRIDLIPLHDSTSEAGPIVPYLDVMAEDEPITFLFYLNETNGILAEGNLHTLQGTKKAGKSAAGLMFIVAALKGEFNGITPDKENLSILWIDTEQDKSTLRQKARAVLSMAELEQQPDSLKIVPLRGIGGPSIALDTTLKAIEDNSPDLVFLDGVVDLCQAFNDEEKSRDVVRKLEEYAEKHNTAILGLIHTNKRDDEARGHLGAIMQQKSAEIYQVNKSGDFAQVKQVCSRFAPVPSFSFGFADDFKIRPAADALSLAKAESRKRFLPLFQDNGKHTAGQLALSYATKYDCAQRKAEADISEAVNLGVLYKSKQGRNVIYSFLFPADPAADTNEEKEYES